MPFVPAELFTAAGGSASYGARFYYAYLCSLRGSANGVCWPSLKTQASALGVVKSQVVRWRQELVDLDWLRLDPPQEGRRVPTTVLLFGTFGKGHEKRPLEGNNSRPMRVTKRYPWVTKCDP